ncbi:hypothetical protein INF30_06985 [Lachnospiraceae bacterium DSM 108991]|uniref:Uncharacterized protein n=1 Tax=Claveliimonas monacensis TaxID=2779351 RepID=A0ABR9RJ84_9FIRM|nr:hypothetical protein [Claveliimonas monacensis]MBE5063003.1 hypothetical protein [Claveliimonas monacensis]
MRNGKDNNSAIVKIIKGWEKLTNNVLSEIKKDPSMCNRTRLFLKILSFALKTIIPLVVRKLLNKLLDHFI